MSNTNTGGPAFPPPLDVVLMAALTPQTGALGMTLRDYFAAKAIPAILEQKDVHNGRELTNAAWIAYQMADAMLKAREA
jgi:hypothetical protein